MGETVYKIVACAQWEAACREGVYRGSEDDQRDGFIHLSSGAQLAGTLRKHFAGQADLLLVSLDADKLGPALRYEPSRDGALFPHLYGELRTAHALTVRPLAPGDYQDVREFPRE